MPAELRLFEASGAWSLEDGCLITYDLSFTKVFRLTGVDAVGMSTGALDGLSGQLAAALSHLPDGSTVRFYSLAVRDHGAALRAYRDAIPAGTIGRSVAEEKVRQVDESLTPLRRELYACVSTTPAASFVPHAPRLLAGGRGLRLRNKALCVHDEKLRESKRLAGLLRTGLGSCDIGCEALDEQETFALMWRLANPLTSLGDHRTPRYRPGMTLRSQLFAGGLRNYLDCFEREGSWHRVITLRVPPLTLTPRRIEEALQGLPFRHMVVTTLQRVSEQKAESRIDRSRHTAFDLQRSFAWLRGAQKQAALPDLEAEEQLSDANDALACLKRGEKLFDVAMQVWFSASTRERLERRTRAIQDAFRDFGNAEVSNEELRGRFAFLSLLPGHHGQMGGGRLHPMVASRAADTLPVFAAWPGAKVPTALLRTHDRQLVGFHPFAFHPSLNANNALVVGSTGVGKSFLVRLLLLGWVTRGQRLIVATAGRDYHRMAELLGGVVYDVSLKDSKLCLGPFPTKQAVEGEQNSAVVFRHLAGLATIMTQERGRELGRIERHFIYRSMERLYERAVAPDFGDWLDAVAALGAEEPERAELATRLAAQMRFWIDGPFGHAFRRNRTDQGSHSFAVWNLEDISGEDTGSAETCAVVLALLSETVRRSIAQGQTIFAQDEAWSVFRTHIGPLLIESYYRTVRKKGSSIWAITQSMADFAALPRTSRSAIINNSHLKCILKHGEDDLQVLTDVLNLGEADQALVANVKASHGAFSDIALFYGERRQLLRLEPSPLEYWIATSDKDDCKYEEALRKANPHLSRWQVVQQAARQHPSGVPRA